MGQGVRRGPRETRLKSGPRESLCQKEGEVHEAVRGSKMSTMLVPVSYTWPGKLHKKDVKATWGQVGICRKRTDVDSLLHGTLTVGGKGHLWWEAESLGGRVECDARRHLQSQYEGLWLRMLNNSSGASDTRVPRPHSRSWFGG